MKNCVRLLMCLVAVLTVAGTAPAALQTGFEQPDYTPGDLNGQQGWQATAGAAAVQGDSVNTGAQAVSVNASELATLDVDGSGDEVVWLEAYLQATPSAQPQLSDTPRIALVYFGRNSIMAFDGNGNGTGQWVSTKVVPQAGQWYRVTARVDFLTKTWDCYVDGVLCRWGLGFKDNSIEALSGIGLGGQTAVSYADDLAVGRDLPGLIADSDSDGIPDAIECENLDTGSGRSNKYLADTDGDGLNDNEEDTNRNGVKDSNETSTRDRDTDDDGYEDGLEVLVLASNPLDPNSPGAAVVDSDGDGLDADNDPNDANPDTDGDRITDGYEALAIDLAAAGQSSITPALGDINEDGNVNNTDALMVQSLFIGSARFTDYPGSVNADTNLSGDITNLDALIIHTYFMSSIFVMPLR